MQACLLVLGFRLSTTTLNCLARQKKHKGQQEKESYLCILKMCSLVSRKEWKETQWQCEPLFLFVFPQRCCDLINSILDYDICANVLCVQYMMNFLPLTFVKPPKTSA